MDGEIRSLSQEGQDVVLVLAAYYGTFLDDGPCTIDFMLWRVSDVETRRVYQQLHLDLEESIGADGFCDDPIGMKECEINPGDCDDCDGDGINECPRGECHIYLFELRDECVPASDVTYHLSSYGPYLNGSWEECWDYVCTDQETFPVGDSGESCELLGADDPKGTDPCDYPGGEIPCGDDDDSVDDDTGDDDDSGVEDDDSPDDDADPDDDSADDTTGPRCGSCSSVQETDGVWLQLAVAISALAFAARRRNPWC